MKHLAKIFLPREEW